MVLAATPRAARACSCVNGSACQLFAGSDAVFVGEVIDVVEGQEAKVARMKVLRGYKGVRTARVVRVSMPPGSSASCSLDVEPGDRYVIYAAKADDGVTTSTCSGSYALGPGQPLPRLPPPGGEVTGRLVRYVGDPPSGVQPIAGARMWIAAPGGRIESRTDAAGRFTLRGVPAGLHQLRFDVGPEENADREIVLSSPNDCADVDVMPRPAGRLDGVVIDPGGRPVAGARVSVIPVGARDRPGGDSDETDATGAFSLRGLSPGAYLVAVGMHDGPRLTFPYEPVFHPGVSDRTLAEPVTIGIDAVRLPPLKLGQPLSTTVLTAEVVCRDGSRPSRAIVTAEPNPRPSPWRFDHVPGEPVDGRYLMKVLAGRRYTVRGSVIVTLRSAAGVRSDSTQRTNAVEVATDPPPALIRLESPLERCAEPGGIIVDLR